MKLNFKVVTWIIGVFATIALLYCWGTANKVLLVAQENIVVDSYPIPDPTRFQSVGKIAVGEKVAVLSCDDLKHYFAIHVRLKSGQEGYIVKGKFTLELLPFWSSTDVPVSFSCPPPGV